MDDTLRFVVMAVLIVMAGMLALPLLFELGPLFLLLAAAAAVYWGLSQASRVTTGPRSPRLNVPRMGPLSSPWSPFSVAPQPRPADWVREARTIADEIRRLVRHGDRATREALSSVPASARKLAEHVAKLARAYQRLGQYLSQNTAGVSTQHALEMEQRAQYATDPFVRDQYLAAAESLRAEAKVCADLAQAHERLSAEVQRILAALASLRSRIVAARSGVSPSGPISSAADDLADLQMQVDNFQASVQQVLNQARRGVG